MRRTGRWPPGAISRWYSWRAGVQVRPAKNTSLIRSLFWPPSIILESIVLKSFASYARSNTLFERSAPWINAESATADAQVAQALFRWHTSLSMAFFFSSRDTGPPPITVPFGQSVSQQQPKNGVRCSLCGITTSPLEISTWCFSVSRVIGILLGDLFQVCKVIAGALHAHEQMTLYAENIFCVFYYIFYSFTSPPLMRGV